MPLEELWDDAGPVPAHRGRGLSTEDIRELLRSGPVRFVVANVGSPLRWVTEGECFRFWKAEVQLRVADPASGVRLEEFPGEYCYFAAQWVPTAGTPLVVLECHH
jgi:hypothetical protein